MEDSVDQTIINVPYRISAKIYTLKIDKNLQFNSKIIWKRHQHKTETAIVRHKDGYSTYDETLNLDLMFKYDRLTGKYLDKITKFLPAIVTQKSLKSGGEAKYNLADPLNKQISSTGNANLETSQTLLLTNCPDETGYIEVSFSYQRLDEEQQILPSVIQNSQINETIPQEDQQSIVMKQVDQNAGTSFIPKSYISAFAKEESFFSKKSANLERKLSEQQQAFNQEKSELEMKILMMQQQMKQLKNRLVDKDQELKHTKAWNESLIKQGQKNQSKLKNVQNENQQLENLRTQKSQLEQKVVSLQKSLISKTTIIANLLNTACDLGGGSLLHRISLGMGSA